MFVWFTFETGVIVSDSIPVLKIWNPYLTTVYLWKDLIVNNSFMGNSGKDGVSKITTGSGTDLAL